MNQAAHVHSIDSLRDFRVAFCNFGTEASQALTSVNVEIYRMLDWLEHDQLKFWVQEVRRREDKVNEARMDLSRCLISTTATGETPSCTDQKVAWEKSKKRLKEAEDKVKIVKHWCIVVEQEVTEYRGPAQQLANVVEGQLPKSLALLDRTIVSLEAYVEAGPPPSLETSGLTTSASSGEAETSAAATPAPPPPPPPDDTPPLEKTLNP